MGCQVPGHTKLWAQKQKGAASAAPSQYLVSQVLKAGRGSRRFRDRHDRQPIRS